VIGGGKKRGRWSGGLFPGKKLRLSQSACAAGGEAAQRLNSPTTRKGKAVALIKAVLMMRVSRKKKGSIGLRGPDY